MHVLYTFLLKNGVYYKGIVEKSILWKGGTDMCAIDMTMPTVYAQRVKSSLTHIELIASSISSAVIGGSDDAYALIPADDMTLARAVMGLAQSNAEFESEVMFR